MTEVFSYCRGSLPLLISIPHDGRELATGMANRMTADGLRLPDTDWHVRRLYDFATTLGAHVIAANYSRYVVDLNRPASDEALYPGQVSTGLCPAQTFDGRPIYRSGQTCTQAETEQRTAVFWAPYHASIAENLARIRDEAGYALLWDAHSIRSEVPMLFDGRLPELNLGSNDGASCDPRLEQAVASEAAASPYSSVVNGRFKGGFITRHYGDPAAGIHALQLELVQACYMDENELAYDQTAADGLRDTLRMLLGCFIDAARQQVA
jgi:N-formylglutamate amidohydrolase